MIATLSTAGPSAAAWLKEHVAIWSKTAWSSLACAGRSLALKPFLRVDVRHRGSPAFEVCAAYPYCSTFRWAWGDLWDSFSAGRGTRLRNSRGLVGLVLWLWGLVLRLRGLVFKDRVGSISRLTPYAAGGSKPGDEHSIVHFASPMAGRADCKNSRKHKATFTYCIPYHRMAA
jgi:hypothetical protein